MRQVGEIIDNCPSCDIKDGVRYRGEDEAACVECGEIFKVEDDAPPQPPPAPPPPPVVANVGELKPIVSSDPVENLQLDASVIGETEVVKSIAEHIKGSRPWRWAQEMRETGNPYRQGTKNHDVFALYANEPMTVEECVCRYAALGHNKRLSYLLAVYEVTMHCLTAGLLVMDADSRKISICMGKPEPVKIV